MFAFIKKKRLLTSRVKAPNHSKWTSLSNQKCTTQPAFINLHLNEYTQAFTVHLQLA